MASNPFPLPVHFHPSSSKCASPLPFAPLTIPKSYPTYIFHNRSNSSTRRRRLRYSISAVRLDNSQESKEPQQQQFNLSVLRFTFGIPGLDESYLPRWIGYTFGSLLLLNHFLAADSVTAVQLRSEVLGLCLAAFSISLPYLGKFLKGANPVDLSTLPEGNKQIFIMPENLSDIQEEDLAWGSFVLLRNTNTMSVIILVQDALCVRGYWNTPEEVSKTRVVDWFKKQIQQIGLSDLKDSLYFPQSTDSLAWEMLPKGTVSLLVEPVSAVLNQDAGEAKVSRGFVLLASPRSYAYSDRDMAWIRAVANKFRVLMGAH